MKELTKLILKQGFLNPRIEKLHDFICRYELMYYTSRNEEIHTLITISTEVTSMHKDDFVFIMTLMPTKKDNVKHYFNSQIKIKNNNIIPAMRQHLKGLKERISI